MKPVVRLRRRILGWAVLLVLPALTLFGAPVFAAETLNVYSIWPENWARPMFEEFEKATGIKVNFVRFSSGEALARVIAEKNNPRVDVLFGGPVETFAAGINEGLFEPYKSPSFAKLPPRFGSGNGSRYPTGARGVKSRGVSARRRSRRASRPPRRTGRARRRGA